MKHLGLKSAFGLLNLAVLMALALFLPAGTMRWAQAWVFLTIFFGGSGFITIWIFLRDKPLLASRLSAGPTAEKRPAQKVIQGFASIGFLAMLLLPAFDRRFGWSAVPDWLSIPAMVAVAVAMLLFFIVYRANSFLSATIEVQGGQRVVSDGPYAIVRHPMYSAALLLFLATPVALGSWVGLAALPVMLPALVFRALDEEAMLRKDLAGYGEYCMKVRYRLVPFLW